MPPGDSVLRQAFLSSLDAELDAETAAAIAREVSLEIQLRRFVGAAQEQAQAWPNVPVDGAALVAFVGRHLGNEIGADDVFEGVRPGDVALACACASGNTAALDVFERGYIGEVDIALARMRVTGAQLADVRQLVRQRLFVAPPGAVPGTPGKIAEYAGRGDLRRWVRAVAVRTCLNELRRGKREILGADDDQRIAQQAMPGDDPELMYMKQTYAKEFKQAFTAALATLGPREQTLLRYHHVDGLNIDEIGSVYRVHRVTAFRWLEKAKEELVQATLGILRQRLKVSPTELHSVLRLIRSQVHLSLVRHLGGPQDRVDDDVLELGDQDLEEVEPEPEPA